MDEQLSPQAFHLRGIQITRPFEGRARSVYRERIGINQKYQRTPSRVGPGKSALLDKPGDIADSIHVHLRHLWINVFPYGHRYRRMPCSPV